MSEPRVIKKYPNRRLYDTVESRYITLADVQRLVMEKIEFVVVDKKNNADITRSILLQVIAEQENRAEPILSQEFMVQVIRSYGANIQPLVSGYLEQSMKLFMSQQPQIRERVKSVTGEAHGRSRSASDEAFKSSPATAGRMRDIGRELGREFGEKDRDEHADPK